MVSQLLPASRNWTRKILNSNATRAADSCRRGERGHQNLLTAGRVTCGAKRRMQLSACCVDVADV